MKFTKKGARKFEWGGLKGWSYWEKGEFENASVSYFEATGAHGRVKTTLSDRVYYVVEGKGEYEIDGEKFEVSKGDVIIVPKNTPYNYWAKGGVLKLFLVHVPAFEPEHEVKMEKK